MKKEPVRQTQRRAASVHGLSSYLGRSVVAYGFTAASGEPFDAAVLPEQFYRLPDSTQQMSGEAALMYAVLEDAISCFQKGTLANGRRPQRLAREAEEWFFTDDLRWPFSFVNICAVLGLDPEFIRLGLKRWRQPFSAERQKRISRVVPVPRRFQIAA
jgi:hypothetical protein